MSKRKKLKRVARIQRNLHLSLLPVSEKFRKRIAFTLAELLITLTITGIILTLTIPNFIASYQDIQLKTALKKFYSDISAATNRFNTYDVTLDLTSDNTIRASYKKVLNFVKEDTYGNLIGVKYLFYKNTSNQGIDTAGSTFPAAMLPNNIIFLTSLQSSSCSQKVGNLDICGEIDVDLNGKKPPNMFGKDSFIFWIIKKNGSYTIVPGGSNGDDLTCVAGSTDILTSGCTVNALMDKMP